MPDDAALYFKTVDKVEILLVIADRESGYPS